MDDPKTPVQLFFAGNARTDTVNDTTSASYIILQNDILHKKYDSMIHELNGVKQERDELDMDNDRLQKSRTCMQGYIMNEHIRASEYKKQVDMYKKASQSFQKYNYGCNLVFMCHLILPYFCGGAFDRISKISKISTIIFQLYFISYCNRSIKSTLDKTTLLKSEREIATIENSTKMIEDILENL